MKSRKGMKSRKEKKSRREKKGGDNTYMSMEEKFQKQSREQEKSRLPDKHQIEQHEIYAKNDLKNQEKMVSNMEQGKYINVEKGSLFVSSHPNKGSLADEEYIPYNNTPRENPQSVLERPRKIRKPYNPNEKSRSLPEATAQINFTRSIDDAANYEDNQLLDDYDPISFGGKKR